MPTDKPANHRYKIGKPCNGGTQLQELHSQQTVPLSSALLFWERRCQAYQMKGQHSCEEDSSAAPEDVVEEQGYQYYDMSQNMRKR